MDIVKIIMYGTDTGKEPFIEWYSRLDEAARPIISERLMRLRKGNFGVWKSIRGYAGIYELIIN